MSKKEDEKKEVKVSQNSAPNQSRRDFIKNSAVVAGAAACIDGRSGGVHGC